MEQLIEQIKKEYQKRLNDEYRYTNKDNPILSLLSEEGLSNLNPITDELFIAMLASEKVDILNHRIEIEKSISEDEDSLDNPSTRSDEKTELRNDIKSAKARLLRLEARYALLSQVYSFLRKDENRDETTPSR